MALAYRRALLKLSGEALAGGKGGGLDYQVVEALAAEIQKVHAMGVHLGRSTKILDRETGEISYGRIPAGSVVVAGTMPSADGSFSTACAVIVKKVDAQTRAKTSVNDLLRG